MKTAQHTSAWLLVKAYSNSEWDTADFMVLHLTPAFSSFIRSGLAAAAAFKDDINFVHIAFSDDPQGWYVTSEKSMDVMRWLTEARADHAFVETDEDELESLSLPEQDIRGCEVRFFSSGYFRYTAWGKHTGEEFSSASIDATLLDA